MSVLCNERNDPILCIFGIHRVKDTFLPRALPNYSTWWKLLTKLCALKAVFFPHKSLQGRAHPLKEVSWNWVRISDWCRLFVCQFMLCISILSVIVGTGYTGCFHTWPIMCKEKPQIVSLKVILKPGCESKQKWYFRTFWSSGSASVIALLQGCADVCSSHQKGNEGRLHQNILEAINKILCCYSEWHFLLLSAQHCDWDGKNEVFLFHPK